MRKVNLGTQGLQVSQQGLGAMGMSVWYGATDEQESARTLNRAIDLGINFIDTAEAYGPFANEKLVAKALGHRRDDIILATKFGGDFQPDGMNLGTDGRPEHVHRAIERSLRHLRVDAIDLYYLHRVDPTVPIEETVGAMGELVTAGKVRFIGLSEAAPDTIRKAHSTFPLTALQSEYSLFERGPDRNGVKEVLAELGIGFVAFSPLGRGFLSGRIRTQDALDASDARRYLPRFSKENIAANLRMVDAVTQLAAAKQVTPSQLALAWVMHQGVVPIPGTKRRSYLEENVLASSINLNACELKALEDAVPVGAVSGERDVAAGLAANYK